MVNVNLSFRNIQGLLPALDQRQPSEPYILEGEDFYFQADGPRNFQGALILEPLELASPRNARSFELDGERIVYLDSEACRTYNNGTRLFETKLSITAHWVSTFDEYPWSRGYVNSKWYFYHPNMGQKLIEYVPATETWTVLTNAFYPTGMRYITQCAGKLIVLGTVFYAWSALDNPADFNPANNAGAGFQGLSIIGGTALVVEELNDGFNVYTTNGIVRATSIDNVALFRHQTVSRKYKILNAFCVVNDDNGRHIALTETGLYSCVDTNYEELDPLFNEFLRFNLFLKVSKDTALNLISETSLLFLSVRLQTNEYYNYAYVLNLKLGKWGKFSRTHYTVSRVDYPVGGPQLTIFGYTDETGRWLHFYEASYIQSFNGIDYSVSQLNSYVIVGLMRFTRQQFSDEVGQVTDMSVGFGSGGEITDYEDWNALNADEDWEALSGEEDWGLDIVLNNSFKLEVVPTLDGRSVYNSVVVPDLAQAGGDQNYYTLDITGVFFKVKISTNTEIDNYALRFLEISGRVAGRL